MKLLRDHFNISQRRFAEVLGVSAGTIAAYESRPDTAPQEARLRLWGEMFGIPYAWFLDGQSSAPPISRDYYEAMGRAVYAMSEDQRQRHTNEMRSIRHASEVVGPSASNIEPVHPDDLTFEEDDFAQGQMVAIPAWQGVLANLNETHFIEEKRPRKVFVPPFFFSRKNPERFIVGLPKGDSMAPRIVAPDRLIVLLASDAQPNSIVVARRSDGVNFVKVLRIDRMGRKELHSIHPEYPPITDLTGWIMKGVLVGIWKPYIHDGTNIEFNGGMPLRA